MTIIRADVTKQLAKEMNVQLETGGLHKSYVKEAGDTKHVRWITMYYRLYQRRKRMVARENDDGVIIPVEIVIDVPDQEDDDA